MTIFDQTKTRYGHREGKLVKYNNKVVVIGGMRTAVVEKMKPTHLWAEHKMSPVNGLYHDCFREFTAVSIEKNLFIFGGSVENERGVLEWNGNSWLKLENALCTSRLYHTTVVFGGQIYHMGSINR